jgi:CelD/BcsL family acetyltransferase involved in cellulose biosynthesis
VTELRLERGSSLDAIRADWNCIGEATTSVFSTWEWASTWWKHVGGDRPLLLWTCRLGDEPVATLPLYLWRTRPLRIARFVGHGPADELGPICRPGHARDVAAALRLGLDEAGCDLLLADQLPCEAGWGSFLGGRRLRHEAAPSLRWTGGWEDFVASRSANLREQLARRERRLRGSRRVDFRLTSDPASLEADLDTLFRLHRAIHPKSDFGPERFHREFAALALDRGWLRLWILDVDERPAAAWYGFRVGGVETYYQAGRDPSLTALSVGFVLLAHTIRTALDDGVREYRFGRGDEAYKYRFATEDAGVETIALAHGALPSAVLHAVSGARAVVSPARRRARTILAPLGRRYLSSKIRNGPPA